MSDIIEEIKPTNFDISQRGISEENLKKFKGKPRQLLVQVNNDGTQRLRLMDGQNFGGKKILDETDIDLSALPVKTVTSENEITADGVYFVVEGDETST